MRALANAVASIFQSQRNRTTPQPNFIFNPEVGVNLAGLVYYIAPNQLVNMVQQGYDFFAKTSNGIDPANIDANGWPTEDCRVRGHNLKRVNVQQDCLGKFTGWADTITLAVNENNRYSILNKAYDSVSNTTTFTLRAAAVPDASDVDNWNVQLNGTRRTGGAGGTINTGATNIYIAHPGYTFADIDNKVWTDEAVTYYSRFRGPLRMMDVQSTNHSTLTSWSQVKRRATHHNTPTYEDMIDLCNKANRPLHMQIMHLFDDASVQAQADFIEANLDPSLYVIISLSNEMWNGAFSF